ncbi:MAG TPA: sigma-70 family RNA polymerase sigma factor, partial [Steroidobacteraceae bacterium]|nr:sigma-70 family RNA polymerase sigma factor [Steroidobacteraceae bacterium]
MGREESAGDSAVGLADPRTIRELREQMLRFATLQLGDPAAAEDAVQEAFVGALKNSAAFRGAAALRTWVFAILKNKIADALRYRRRTVTEGSLADGESEDDSEEAAPSVFDSRGHWLADTAPADWGDDPEAALHQADFWRVFNACLDHLPPRQARVLMMREFIEFDAEEICRSVGITAANLHV